MSTPLCCSRCGYELRGLPPNGRCPECGTPIRDSRVVRRAEWSPVLGLRRAAHHAVVYTAATAFAFFALLWILRPLLNWLAANTIVLRAVLALQLLAFPLGFILARLHWRRLCDSAGFAGGVLIPLAVFSIAASVMLGSWTAVHFLDVAPRPTILVAVSSVVIAYGFCSYDILAD